MVQYFLLWCILCLSATYRLQCFICLWKYMFTISKFFRHEQSAQLKTKMGKTRKLRHKKVEYFIKRSDQNTLSGMTKDQAFFVAIYSLSFLMTRTTRMYVSSFLLFRKKIILPPSGYSRQIYELHLSVVFPLCSNVEMNKILNKKRSVKWKDDPLRWYCHFQDVSSVFY